MKIAQNRHSIRRATAQSLARRRKGKVKYALFAWLLGLPLPIILLALVFRGCDW